MGISGVLFFDFDYFAGSMETGHSSETAIYLSYIILKW